jgi:hypothetical protein
LGAREQKLLCHRDEPRQRRRHRARREKGSTILREWLDAEIENLAAGHFFLPAYNTELRPFFGAAVKTPADVIIEGN